MVYVRSGATFYVVRAHLNPDERAFPVLEDIARAQLSSDAGG
jgi:hypothetical protein